MEYPLDKKTAIEWMKHVPLTTIDLIKMKTIFRSKKLGLFCLPVLVTSLLSACTMQWGAAIQWNSKDQILMSESSQVKMRTLQTRIFDTTDKDKIMRAIISTMQDLYFDIEVMDDGFGIVSGKKLYQSGSGWENAPSYYNYKTDNLVIFSTNYRTYGPFQYRNDLTRISVTIRPKGETQLKVRASIQHNLYAVEAAEVYQKFFKLLGESIFLSAGLD